MEQHARKRIIHFSSAAMELCNTPRWHQYWWNLARHSDRKALAGQLAHSGATIVRCLSCQVLFCLSGSSATPGPLAERAELGSFDVFRSHSLQGAVVAQAYQEASTASAQPTEVAGHSSNQAVANLGRCRKALQGGVGALNPVCLW